jgi:NitT/TauT family transport system substrate-binding protein
MSTMPHRPTRRDALTALAATGAAALAPRAARAQTLTPLALAGVPEDSITPVLYGVQSGLFRKYGLDVSIAPQRSGPAISSAVLGGAYQIGKASITPLILGHAKGVPFAVVAPAGLYNVNAPIDGMFVQVDSPYKTAADLNGKTFGVYGIGDIFTIATKAWMAKNGGDPASVKFVELPISAMVPAIESGRIDAGSMNEPAVQLALGSPKLRLLAHPFAAVAPHFMYTAWFTTVSYAAANPAVVANFQRAMHEAATYVNGHHEQTVDLLAQFTAVDAAIIRKMARVDQGVTLDPQLIQPVIDTMAQFKDIAAGFAATDLIAKERVG